MQRISFKFPLALLAAVCLAMPQLSWAPGGRGSFGGGGRSFGGGSFGRSSSSSGTFSRSSTSGGSFGRSGSFGSRTYTGTTTRSGAFSGSRAVTPPPILPSSASRSSYSWGGTTYRSVNYGGWSDYSYYWSPWHRTPWYYYTPFHPAFFYSPPYYASDGYYYPGGISFFRVIVGLAVFGFVIWLLFKLFAPRPRVY